MTDPVADLVVRASRGNKAAVDDLLLRYLPDLRRYLRLRCGRLVAARESVSDLVQSVCREALEDLPELDYRGEASFKAWLFRLASHKVIDRARHWHRDRRDAAREVDPSDEEEDLAELEQACRTLITPSRDAVAREELRRFEAALAAIPDEYREAILLQRLCGLPYSEIARALDRSEGAVRNLVYRGLARLSVELRQR